MDVKCLIGLGVGVINGSIIWITAEGYWLVNDRVGVFGDSGVMHAPPFTHASDEIPSGGHPMCYLWSSHVHFTSYYHGKSHFIYTFKLWDFIHLSAWENKINLIVV